MSKIRAVMFWIIAMSAAILYGAMYMGRYALPMSFDPSVPAQALPRVLHVVLEHYTWLPSFLAGFILGRRGAWLGVLTVVGGAVESRCKARVAGWLVK